MPSNVSEALRKSDNYIKGGMAGLPLHNNKKQALKSVIFPFDSGECFACMAETIGLTMYGKWTKNNIGDLHIEQLKKISQVMQKEGFQLTKIKKDNSY